MNFVYGTLENYLDKSLLKVENTKIELNADKLKYIDKSSRNYEVIVGFRPENIELINNDDNNALIGIVETIENMGSKCYVHINFQGRGIIIKVDAEFNTNIGEKIAFRIKEDKVKVFDKETEITIY